MAHPVFCHRPACSRLAPRCCCTTHSCTSQAVHGKMAFLSNLASLHPMAKAVSDPEAALAGLMGKMGQFKQALSHPGQGQFRSMMTGNATQSG